MDLMEWTLIGAFYIFIVQLCQLTMMSREYPVAPERGGVPADFANYPTWLSNLRASIGAAGYNWGVSMTIPSSFWYLQNFDIVKLAGIIDWFNVMGKQLLNQAVVNEFDVIFLLTNHCI